ncbi:plasmid SOS inhibition protein A [Salmonella enterica]|nr:plasmid SOS inhibition protein A [Salmonella enterica]
MGENAVPGQPGQHTATTVNPDVAALRGGIPKNRALVCLYPERQAALQAIIDVESATGLRRFTCYPYAAAFFRRLSGRSRVSGRALRAIIGIRWDPRDKLTTLSDYEMAFDTLIRTRGECCPTPLSGSTRHWLFPEVEFQQQERERQRARLAGHKYTVKSRRQWEKQREQEAVQYFRVVQQAALDLNFQSPDTFCQWNMRHPELKEAEWLAMFWRWQARFPSLQALEWLHYSNEPAYVVVINLQALVSETPAVVCARERLYVPNKLR